MQQSNQTAFNREDIMAFLSNTQTINLLSAEDKALIASTLVLKDQEVLNHFLDKLKDGNDDYVLQTLQERNSLPVF